MTTTSIILILGSGLVLVLGVVEEEEHLDVVSTGNAALNGNSNSGLDDDNTIPFFQMLQQQHPSSDELLPIPDPLAPSPPTFQMLLTSRHHKLPSNPPPPPLTLQNPLPPTNALDPDDHEICCCLTHSPSVTFDPCTTHIMHEPLLPSSSRNNYSHTQPKSKSARQVILQPERKKKRKTAATTTRRGKEKGDVVSQRMTHIAVERNRRRLMNDHLRSLRSLMPPSYAQRGDQASIIGGTIDFVKELEQLLESLEAQKRYCIKGRRRRRRRNSATNLNLKQVPSKDDIIAAAAAAGSASTLMEELDDGYCNNDNNNQVESEWEEEEDAQVRVVAMMEKHVNLKVEYICGGGVRKRKRKEGELPLLRAITALEQLNLTVLHLNITTTATGPSTSLHRYSFSLKMEDECMLRSREEIVVAVHQIFSL